MSTLILVRHGQASFQAEDYDQLSALGQEQGRILGRALSRLGQHFDEVYTGPLRRHRQTQDAALEGYATGGQLWPAPVTLPQFDEHHGAVVMERVLPELAEHDPAIASLLQQRRQGQQEEPRAYLRAFQQVTRRWVRGELDLPEHESWRSFKQRVQQGLEQIVNQNQNVRGRTVIAFTSGGVIAAAMGLALKLNDEQVISLSWLVRNASYSEFLFSGHRFSLSVFNAVSHFNRAELLTYV